MWNVGVCNAFHFSRPGLNNPPRVPYFSPESRSFYRGFPESPGVGGGHIMEWFGGHGAQAPILTSDLHTHQPQWPMT